MAPITIYCARSSLNIHILLKLLSEIFCFYLCVHVRVYICHAYATAFWSQNMSEPLKLELQVIRSHLGSSEGAVQPPNHQVISPVQNPVSNMLNIRCKRIPGHLKLSFRFILYVMGVLPACLCVHMHAWDLGRSEEVAGSHGATKCWELNLGPLEEQHVFLTTKFSHLTHFFGREGSRFTYKELVSEKRWPQFFPVPLFLVSCPFPWPIWYGDTTVKENQIKARKVTVVHIYKFACYLKKKQG